MNSLHTQSPPRPLEQRRSHCHFEDLDAIVDDFERNLRIANQELRDVVQYASSVFSKTKLTHSTASPKTTRSKRPHVDDEGSSETSDTFSTITSCMTISDNNEAIDDLVVSMDPEFAIDISKVLNGDCDVTFTEDGESIVSVQSMAKALHTLIRERNEFIAESLELMQSTQRVRQYEPMTDVNCVMMEQDRSD
mmetsp:Transcript_9114/g.13176  ORF Transcript_9114/g.13176 Transcript_9114/m.13176 type:complete len:193 (+) Transcript_9114:2-580(+)